ncbi:ATP-dependent Lon protease [Galdieria sulphuraria]|uniref:ATP-dependent Lon protease n=1 Tax=Galdieria sulphuraria TaxID=130081 RepID=M2W4G3_GALSU|nr:ATP-dependent Lon protease [Galdieria sulphuraria]EME30641.1 ATP-dependent Lon protease [Galdieria sulphuraria]|eukprot:XP_005707161.1 ATP-dependent Lon protease [Galdieria sulphuraria]
MLWSSYYRQTLHKIIGYGYSQHYFMQRLGTVIGYDSLETFKLIQKRLLYQRACYYCEDNGHNNQNDKKPSNKAEGLTGASHNNSSGNNAITPYQPDGKSANSEGGSGNQLLQKFSRPQGPAELPAIPLFRRPLFPGVVAPITVSDPSACETFISLFRSGFRYVGLFLHRNAGQIGAPWSGQVPNQATDSVESSMEQKNESDEETNETEVSQQQVKNEDSQSTIHQHPLFTNPSELYRVGVLAELFRVIPRSTGIELTFLCHHRIRWTSVGKIKPILYLQTEPIREEPVDIHDPQVRAYALAIVETLKEIMNTGSLYKEQLQLLLESVDVNNPYQLADLGASLTSADPHSLQQVLEAMKLEDRLVKTLNLLKTELETARVQQKINKQVEESVSNAQRRYFLTEQLKYIKKELGLEKDEKETLLAKFRERMEKKAIPKQAKAVIEEELSKLSLLEPASSEYSVSRNYLEWLTSLPWGITTLDKLDLKHAEKILEEDHYGLKDVKQRILEFIAELERQVLERASQEHWEENFYRFSVGGMSDVSEIKGHRRTYVGAMPGKLIQALKVAGSSNPLIMIDEIDKLGTGFQGSPADALLEVLDREQNSAFLDHYLDVPYDLSQVLFICTANLTEDIPLPLLDRMEHIELPGYVLDEKIAIAKKYLVPKARKESGIKATNVVIRDSALRALAEEYCKEPGVRDLRNKIDAIYRKAALKIADDSSSSKQKISISQSDLTEYIGTPRFKDWRIYEMTPAGVAIGLSYTRLGGSLLYIEAIDTGSGKGSLKTTGRLGQVMTESTDIAYSFAKGYLKTVQAANRFFETASIHLHFPEGASSKEGPSAGCAIVTALLSLAMNIPVCEKLAMTGEITLTGKVLAVGGIREKVMAARQGNMKTVILPAGNKSDWEELDDCVKNGMRGIFVKEYSEVFQVAFPSIKLEHKSLKKNSHQEDTSISDMIAASRFWGTRKEEYDALDSLISDLLSCVDLVLILIRTDLDKTDSLNLLEKNYFSLLGNQLVLLSTNQDYTLTQGLNYLLTTAVKWFHETHRQEQMPLFFLVSVEIRPSAFIKYLVSVMDEDTLCAGCAIPQEHAQVQSIRMGWLEARLSMPEVKTIEPVCSVSLSAFTCPWNTCCLWNMKHLQRTGFLMVADWLTPPGMEEVSVIAVQQKLFGILRRQVKLVYLPSQWAPMRHMEGYSLTRRDNHEEKMLSKQRRTREIIEQLGSCTGNVMICVPELL